MKRTLFLTILLAVCAAAVAAEPEKRPTKIWNRTGHWHQPLLLTFDSETMPDWMGMPKDEDLPSTFSVEYVRAWKRK